MGYGYISASRTKYGYRLTESTCSVCGKRFLRGTDHVYRNGDKLQCSYTCYRVLDELDRQKRREALDKTLAALERSDRQSVEKKAERRRQPEYRLEKAQNRVRHCEEMIDMFSARAAQLYKGSYQHKNARDKASSWRKKLMIARQEVVRIKREMEANKNVQSTSEEETLG